MPSPDHAPRRCAGAYGAHCRPQDRGRAGRPLSAVLLLLVFVGTGCEDRAARAIDQAHDLAFQGRYERAVEVLDETIDELEGTREQEGAALKLRALADAGRFSHLFLRSPERALVYYRRLVELSPDSEEAFAARERMATIYLEAGDRTGAIAQYQALVAGFVKREGIDRFQLELARAYFAAGDLEQARMEARHLLERWPESEHAVRVKMLIANSYYVQGRLEEALEAYERLRRETTDPDLAARVLFEQAGCLAGLDRKEEAVAAYQEALETHPEPRVVRVRLERLRERMARRALENLESPW